MKVLSPIGGTVEWRVEIGAVVAERAVLGWIAGPGRCGLIPIVAPGAGRVTWRRSAALEVTWQGEAAVLINGDEAELRDCLAGERDAAARTLHELVREVSQLAQEERGRPLGEALLGPQRREMEQRIAAVRALIAG